MSSYAVGKEVISYCGSCKLKLGHLITAMKENGSIAKCKCNTCGASHGYRASAPGKKRTTAISKRSKKKDERPLSEIWQEGLKKIDSFIPYNIRTIFSVGDGIDHKSFGKGFVQNINDQSKIDVVFQNEIKTLVHAR